MNVLKEEERAVDVEVCCVGFTVMLTELVKTNVGTFDESTKIPNT